MNLIPCPNKVGRGGSILVYDLEMTCWEHRELKPSNEESEIIAIGWCFLDTMTWVPYGMQVIHVKPVRSNISRFCTDLTGITSKDVKGGMVYPALCQHLIHKRGFRQYLSASWGIDDQAMAEQCIKDSTDYPFSGRHLDIGALYQTIRGSDKSIGLVRALSELGLEFEGREHRPQWDAWNTARILAAVLAPGSSRIFTQIQARVDNIA